MAVSKESRTIRRMFADISGRYDLLNHVLSLNVDRSWRRRAAKELGVRPGDRLLDVCTGTADLALELARRVQSAEGGHVCGTDFCREMVEIGERKRLGKDEDRLSLTVGDALELPFTDASFDGVTVAFGVRNLCDLRRGLGEMRRVLKPGGRLGILEFTTPRSKWFASLYAFYFRRVLPRIGRWLSSHPTGAEAYTYLPASVSEFPTAPAFCSLLEEVGFRAVRHVLLTGGIAALYLGERTRDAAATVDERDGLEPGSVEGTAWTRP
ncbi:MAG: bifunctional demethylmenaquinone methyltransferase/2-methoxy-6-polyprenyl-1,4-benzoquinol methylase UbiE [Planctomycetota bacterium]|nr:bifunctional demethylmenaquinone methyltransferase/2-methoxy-6-polyprenyl-1,4-benzoquinol methylase UbiE [Planctomycetota bacterium]